MLHSASQVRFELKTDKGSFMVSVEPPPEELMFPQTLSKPDFQRALGSMRQLEQASVECQVSKIRFFTITRRESSLRTLIHIQS